jgi:hypothetical protein
VAVQEIAKAVAGLTADEIRRRLEELREEELGLRVMLRSATARERAQRLREQQGGNRVDR